MRRANAVLSIRISIEERDGWYVATSQDLPGLVLAHPDRDVIERDLPGAIELLYATRFNCKCKAVPIEFAGQPETDRVPWLLVPPEVANDQLVLAARA